jgi:hypothetical protein
LLFKAGFVAVHGINNGDPTMNYGEKMEIATTALYSFADCFTVSTV